MLQCLYKPSSIFFLQPKVVETQVFWLKKSGVLAEDTTFFIYPKSKLYRFYCICLANSLVGEIVSLGDVQSEKWQVGNCPVGKALENCRINWYIYILLNWCIALHNETMSFSNDIGQATFTATIYPSWWEVTDHRKLLRINHQIKKTEMLYQPLNYILMKNCEKLLQSI